MNGELVAPGTTRCKHLNFQVFAQVARLTDTDEPGARVTGFAAGLRILCSECHMPFQWMGLPMGMSNLTPATSPDKLELRAPIMPVEEL